MTLSNQFNMYLNTPDLIGPMVAFGEHDYPEQASDPAKDPEGNVLAHEHTMPKRYFHDLNPVQKMMVGEGGVRQLNSYQDLGERS